MGRDTTKTHKETVSPSFRAEETPDPVEETTSSSSEKETSNTGEETAETSQVGGSPETSESSSEVLFDDDLGVGIPRDEGVIEPVAPNNLLSIDFGHLPSYKSRIGEAEANKILRKYPFRAGFGIEPPGPKHTAEKPPMGSVAIYKEQLEAGLRMTTTRFFRDVLRYFAVRITQLVPNAIRILVGFEMLCRHQEVTPTVGLFRRCYTIKKHGMEKGWFYFCNRNNAIPSLVIGAPSSIKNWKKDFFFVSVGDFPWGFWWRPVNAKNDPSAGDLDEKSFQKLMGSGLRIYSRDYPEAVLIDGGISRAVINPEKKPLFSLKLQKTLKKVSDIITSGSAAVVKRPKRKTLGETSTPPPKKKTTSTSAVKVSAAPSASAAAISESTSSVPKRVPVTRVTTAIPAPFGRGKQLKLPVNPVTGSSLWNRFHSPPVFHGEDKTHPGEHWCPEWKVSVNDRCTSPRVAQELVMHSYLPRDLEFTKKLSPAELVQSIMVATASNTAFVAKMAHRYCALVEEKDTGSLQNKIFKLEKKLTVSDSEKTKLQRRLQQAETKEEESEATINSLRSALEEEQRWAEEEKKSHQQLLQSAGTSAVAKFRRSEAFTKNLGELTLPSFMFGYTTAIDEIAAHLAPADLESFKNKANYNEDSKEFCDRVAEGIQACRDLAEIRDEFNKWLSELDEVFEEKGGGEETTLQGDERGETHDGGEPHLGGGEADKEAGQEGSETRV